MRIANLKRPPEPVALNVLPENPHLPDVILPIKRGSGSSSVARRISIPPPPPLGTRLPLPLSSSSSSHFLSSNFLPLNVTSPAPLVPANPAYPIPFGSFSVLSGLPLQAQP